MARTAHVDRVNRLDSSKSVYDPTASGLTATDVKAAIDEVVVSVVAVAPLTTKGDVLGYSTLPEALAVGTNGQVIVADSARATGLKYENKFPTTTQGDIMAYRDATYGTIRVAKGTDGQVLTTRATIGPTGIGFADNVNAGAVPVATYLYDTNSSAAQLDYIGIGGIKFEFLDDGDTLADDTSIGVLIGGSAAITFASFIGAVNGVVVAPTGIIDSGGDPAAVANTTIFVAAELIDGGATRARVQLADEVGGDAAAGAGTYALTNDMFTATNIWETGDVNMSTLGGTAPGRFASTKVTITTAMITPADFRIAFPFDVAGFTIMHTTGGVPVASAAIVTDTHTIDEGDILITKANAVHYADGDVLYVTAWA